MQKFSCRYAAQLRFSTCVPRQLTPQISITLHMAYILREGKCENSVGLEGQAMASTYNNL